MFRGSYVALATPFTSGSVDVNALKRLVNWHIKRGTHGIVPVGTTGESSTLSVEEHKQVVEIVVAEAAGRVPVVAGAGSNNPAEALELLQHAESVGADAALCVAGYYNRPNQEGLYRHFEFLHDHSTLPLIIYNVPPRTIVDIEPVTVQRLAKLPRVCGVKDATGDLARISDERLLIRDRFCYFSGEDMTAVAYNSMGGTGCISVTANVAPALCVELQSACRLGDYALALKIHECLAPLHRALFIEPSPAGVKYAMSKIGLCDEYTRLPLVPLSEQTKREINRALMDLKLI